MCPDASLRELNFSWFHRLLETLHQSTEKRKQQNSSHKKICRRGPLMHLVVCCCVHACQACMRVVISGSKPQRFPWTWVKNKTNTTAKDYIAHPAQQPSNHTCGTNIIHNDDKQAPLNQPQYQGQPACFFRLIHLIFFFSHGPVYPGAQYSLSSAPPWQASS